jgi:hypothetical protein
MYPEQPGHHPDVSGSTWSSKMVFLISVSIVIISDGWRYSKIFFCILADSVLQKGDDSPEDPRLGVHAPLGPA